MVQQTSSALLKILHSRRRRCQLRWFEHLTRMPPGTFYVRYSGHVLPKEDSVAEPGLSSIEIISQMTSQPWWCQQSDQRSPDISQPSHLFQLIQGHTEADFSAQTAAPVT